MRLGTKALIPLALILVVGFGAFTYITQVRLETELLRRAKSASKHEVDTLITAVDPLMKKALNRELRIILKSFGDFTLYPGPNPPGTAWEKDPSKLETVEDLASQINDSRALEIFRTGQGESFIDRVEDTDLLVLYEPILNKASCKKCHYGGQKLLGVIRHVTSLQDIEDFSKSSRERMFLISGGILVFVVGAIFLVLRIVATHPLNRMAQHVRLISRGDFRDELPVGSDDELGDMAGALNEMRAVIARVSSQLHLAAAQVASASEEVSASSQTLYEGSRNQASAVEDLAARAADLAQTVTLVSEETIRVQGHTQTAVAQAKKGQATVDLALGSMSRIADSSKQISEITNVVTSLARETELLALNATIEAARAGEHGAGFAVVAEEIRSLAERSGRAATEIRELIQEAANRVQDGMRNSQNAGENLGEIVDGSLVSTESVAAIVDSCSSQREVSEGLNDAVEDVNAVVRSNLSAAEALTQASAHLAEQASNVREVVGWFQLEGTEFSARSAPRRASDDA